MLPRIKRNATAYIPLKVSISLISNSEILMSSPVHTIRFGFIKASIWQNRTRSGDRHSVSIVRLYKNGDTWVESTRFGRDDLPLVAKLSDMAHTWIYQHGYLSAECAAEQPASENRDDRP